MQISRSWVAKVLFISTLRGKQLIDSLIFGNFETISKSCWWGGQNCSDGQTLLFSTKDTLYLKHTTFLGATEPIHDLATRKTENYALMTLLLGHSSYVDIDRLDFFDIVVR